MWGFEIPLAVGAVALSRFANPPKIRHSLWPFLNFGFVLMVVTALAYWAARLQLEAEWTTAHLHREAMSPGYFQQQIVVSVGFALFPAGILVMISLITQTRWWGKGRQT